MVECLALRLDTSHSESMNLIYNTGVLQLLSDLWFFFSMQFFFFPAQFLPMTKVLIFSCFNFKDQRLIIYRSLRQKFFLIFFSIVTCVTGAVLPRALDVMQWSR